MEILNKKQLSANPNMLSIVPVITMAFHPPSRPGKKLFMDKNAHLNIHVPFPEKISHLCPENIGTRTPNLFNKFIPDLKKQIPIP